MDLLLDGHLFDSGLINQVLDILELQSCTWDFLQCAANANPTKSPSAKSKVLLRITGSDATVLAIVQTKIETLISVVEKADATVFRHDWNATSFHSKRSASESARVVEPDKPQNILLLGAGMVSHSVVNYLGRRTNRSIVVASDNENEARKVAGQTGRHVGLDITNDARSLSQLVQEADVVVSLLPAPLHPKVAENCIEHRKHLVTASYESDVMRELNERYVASILFCCGAHCNNETCWPRS
jgi:alpha-aminoadipic semialdehyde synthase